MIAPAQWLRATFDRETCCDPVSVVGNRNGMFNPGHLGRVAHILDSFLCELHYA
jgi:hypothetical protein